LNISKTLPELDSLYTVVIQVSISLAAKKRIRNRERSNILKEAEFKTIEFLCSKMPRWVTPDILTFTGVVGSLIVFLGLYLALQSKYCLLISILGLAVHWFGDSLDGRLAYYRNTPRKWYGWALDLNADWVSICIIGLGFYFYFPQYKFLAFVFVIVYGGSMILSLIQYKINNQYIIDKASMGPTELRIIISIILLIEIFVPYTLIAFSAIASIGMLVLNAKESLHILNEGDFRDKVEKQATRNIQT